MSHRRLSIILVSALTLLFFASVRPVQAAPSRVDEVILRDDFVLHEGERLDGDLVIIGGDLTMLAGSRVEGSVTVLGGRVEVNGTVENDLVSLGGDLTLGALARIRGDTVAFGGRIQRDPGAETGDIVRGPTVSDIKFWRGLRLSIFAWRFDSGIGSIIGATVTTLASALVLAILGVAIVSFWPTQTAQVGETLLTAPLPSLGVGCLIYPLAASFAFFVLLTICLSPFVPVVVLLVVAASLFGWVALGRLFGRWLASWTGWRSTTPLAVTGTGVFALTVVATIAGTVPLLGSIVVLCAACMGLGAVALSRFGTRPFRRGSVGHPPTEA